MSIAHCENLKIPNHKKFCLNQLRLHHMRVKIKEIFENIKKNDKAKFDKFKKIFNIKSDNAIQELYITVGVSVSLDQDLRWWDKSKLRKYRINRVRNINSDELENDTDFNKENKPIDFQPSEEYPPEDLAEDLIEEDEAGIEDEAEDDFFEPDDINFFEPESNTDGIVIDSSSKTGGGENEEMIALPWIYLIYLIKNTLNKEDTLDLKNKYIASLLYFFKEEHDYFTSKYPISQVKNYGKKGKEASMYAVVFTILKGLNELENTIYTIKDLSNFIHDNYTDKANNAMIMGGKNKNTKKYKKVTRGTKRSRTKRSRTKRSKTALLKKGRKTLKRKHFSKNSKKTLRRK
jgi:hypothetical protein